MWRSRCLPVFNIHLSRLTPWCLDECFAALLVLYHRARECREIKTQLEQELRALVDRAWSEWLDNCSEQFLPLYTAHYLHLGETATSRTESAHWLLKQDLHVSTNDLLVVLQNFKRVVDRQFARIQYEIESEKIRRPTELSPRDKLLINRIPSRANQHVKDVVIRYLPKGEDKPYPSELQLQFEGHSRIPMFDAWEDQGERPTSSGQPSESHQSSSIFYRKKAEGAVGGVDAHQDQDVVADREDRILHGVRSRSWRWIGGCYGVVSAVRVDGDRDM
ncbi:unnamed protein product [Penicillium viridicatum]